MPYLADRSARLYYDDSCGPCRFLARAAEGMSHHRVEAVPLGAPAADVELGALPVETRYGSAHLSIDGALRTGDGVPVPLLGLTLGPRWEQVARKVPIADRALRSTYVRLWKVRQRSGCGAKTAP